MFVHFSKYNIFAHFFIFFIILSNTDHGQGSWLCLQSQPKTFPYPFPNIKLVLLPHSLFTSQHNSNNNYGVTVIAYKKTWPVSKLTTPIRVDTDSNNDDNKQYFETPIKNNHSTPETLETNNKNAPVQATVYSHIV